MKFVSYNLQDIFSLSVQDEEAILSKLEASSVLTNSGSEAVSARLIHVCVFSLTHVTTYIVIIEVRTNKIARE